MTEKRFTQKDEDDWEILDRNKHFAYAHSGYQAKKIIQELNELVETNRELYKKNKELKARYNRCIEEMDSLAEVNDKFYKENKELKAEIEKIAYANDDLLKEKREWKKLSDEYAKLYEENEQLKHFIQELTTMGTAKIHLANGSIYNVNAILTEFKCDVE